MYIEKYKVDSDHINKKYSQLWLDWSYNTLHGCIFYIIKGITIVAVPWIITYTELRENALSN